MDVLQLSDQVTMEISILFLLFINVMTLGVVVRFKKARTARFLLVGNLMFLLMHISVLVSISTSFQSQLFVGMFNIIGISFYLRTIAAIFDIKIPYNLFGLIHIVHFILLIILFFLKVPFSYFRATTFFFTTVLIGIFGYLSYQHNRTERHMDSNTIALITVLLVYHFGWFIFKVLDIIPQTTPFSLQQSIIIQTLLLLMLIFWTNFSLFFALFHKLSRLYEHMSYHDSLTDLHNRRYMMDQIRRHIQLADRNGMQFGLLSIDIDGFKNINDHHGHLFGDQVLKEFAQMLIKYCRSTDIVARMGGDEFMVLVVLDSPEELVQTQKRLQHVMSKVQYTELEMNIAFSIGSALYDQAKDMDLESLMVSVDQYLYRDKRGVTSKSAKID
jgi:diguanylate cyclase (GGDEF)-like protein